MKIDKKVIKAMLTEVCSLNDEPRKHLRGVHFEESRCIATDTHILAVYKHGNEKNMGKTINLEGEVLKGNFPPVDKVIPKKPKNPLTRVDFAQLHRACSWWCRQSTSNRDDQIILGSQSVSIRYLRKMLYLLSLTNELGAFTLYLGDAANKPIVAVSEEWTILVMPCVMPDETLIDDECFGKAHVCVSYANLINTYAIESTKKTVSTKKPELDWL